jgi:ribosomal protein S18 acetylase RimI-like enzyme
MSIRPVTREDHDSVWSILEPAIRSGETYALPRDMNRQAALAYWLAPGHEVFVAEDGGVVVGTYFVRANQPGGGAHVANAAYMVALSATGRGIAQRMCEHSLEHARARGFSAMQFNFVVSTNERAVRLWERLGFATVGRVPKAFSHPAQGLVDVLVMHRAL